MRDNLLLCVSKEGKCTVSHNCVCGGDERGRGWEGGSEEGQEEEEKKIDRDLLCAGVTPGRRFLKMNEILFWNRNRGT